MAKKIGVRRTGKNLYKGQTKRASRRRLPDFIAFCRRLGSKKYRKHENIRLARARRKQKRPEPIVITAVANFHTQLLDGDIIQTTLFEKSMKKK